MLENWQQRLLLKAKLVLEEVTPSALSAFLSFIYGQPRTTVTTEDCILLNRLADKFVLCSLVI